MSIVVFGSLFIGAILILFVNRKSLDSPYILIIGSGENGREDDIIYLLKQSVKRYGIKSKTVSDFGMELTFEVRLKENSTKFMGRVKELSGVRSVALVSYNGDYIRKRGTAVMIKHKWIGLLTALLMAATVSFVSVGYLMPSVFESITGSAEPPYAAAMDKTKVLDIQIIADEKQWADMLQNATAEQYISATVIINGKKYAMWASGQKAIQV